MSERPEYDDPERYAWLDGFSGELSDSPLRGDWRDLWHDAGFLRFLAARLRVADAGTVLDVGCGAGHWGRTVLRHIAPEAKLHGVDREPHFVALASAAAQQSGLDAHYLRATRKRCRCPTRASISSRARRCSSTSPTSRP
jgi:hypothetical protein